jgi:hypothetical protein
LIVAVHEKRRADKSHNFGELGMDAMTMRPPLAGVAGLAILGIAPRTRDAVVQKMTAVELPRDE